MTGQFFSCPFRTATGLYCPGCGGTRAVWYLLHGQLLLSIRCHPLVLYALVMALLELGGYLLFKWTGKDRLYLRRYGSVIFAGVIIVMVNWIVKNYMLVAWGIEMIPEGWRAGGF